jgi:hypothetical protein
MHEHYVTDAERNLAGKIAVCLEEADRQGLTEAGIFLDRALVALVGTGLLPSFASEADIAELREELQPDALFDAV